jgi:nascent polypeptide-associated complex subunit alpha
MNLNNRQIQHAMKRMGIAQTELDATEVIIKTPDKEIVISDPQVVKVNMMGNQTFQVSGTITERGVSSAPDFDEDDIITVIEQTGSSRQDVIKAIEESQGDLAQAILKLKDK